MSMSKMLKCKLCGSEEYKNHVVYKNKTEKLISRPDEGCIENSIIMNDDGYFIASKIELGVGYHGELMIPIHYCPFCGNELD